MKNWKTLKPNSAKRMEEFKRAFYLVPDKSCHDYQRVYAHYLPKKANYILEIGLANYGPDKTGGALHTSLTAWPKLYPEAQIYGADCAVDKMLSGVPNIKTYVVDQGSQPSLLDFAKTLVELLFNIILH